jgi:hypothetical protein
MQAFYYVIYNIIMDSKNIFHENIKTYILFSESVVRLCLTFMFLKIL